MLLLLGLGFLFASFGSGTQRWRFATGATRADMGVQSSPALSPDGGSVYVGANDGSVHALASADGTERWRFSTSGAIGYSSPAVSLDGGTLFVGSADRHLHCINATTGAALWRFRTGGAVSASPVLSPDGATIYVGYHLRGLVSTWARGTRGSILRRQRCDWRHAVELRDRSEDHKPNNRRLRLNNRRTCEQ